MRGCQLGRPSSALCDSSLEVLRQGPRRQDLLSTRATRHLVGYRQVTPDQAVPLELSSAEITKSRVRGWDSANWDSVAAPVLADSCCRTRTRTRSRREDEAPLITSVLFRSADGFKSTLRLCFLDLLLPGVPLSRAKSLLLLSELSLLLVGCSDLGGEPAT